MTKLFFKQGACSLAPHIVLEWIGKPYEAVRVTSGSPEILAVNPTGAVPVLQEDDGWVLTQAGAILEYLANKHPEAGLGGGDSIRARAETHKWSAFLTSDVHAAFWPVFMPDRYTTDPSDAAKAAVFDAAIAQVRKKFAILNDHMAGREWFLDGGRSVIDAYSFPMIRWARGKLPNGLTDYPHVQALHDRLAADQSVQTILAREAGK
ncbi:glutathione S-transferase [Xinfangfangia sp. D13-10-4-6]|uniref:glutathione S-transferase family protein n=1 Tax=Pseudogemmobacter hezensis TaxID=2737662 RepID=UPI001556F2C1|nr:glutathione S-transferase N-terminal domain-containing protein [Pseudogemmobacter hezensis]NPD13906.1 glutathione S-transferase [Pseudogemmobacter hezensis]